MHRNFGKMKIKEIISALERFAPLPLQDGFDNAGLQIGLTEAEATGALLCLDVTEAVLDEAIALGYNLVIAHHEDSKGNSAGRCSAHCRRTGRVRRN